VCYKLHILFHDAAHHELFDELSVEENASLDVDVDLFELSLDTVGVELSAESIDVLFDAVSSAMLTQTMFWLAESARLIEGSADTPSNKMVVYRIAARGFIGSPFALSA